jgi:hypothetical protein
MSEITEAAKGLQQWPVVEGFFIIVIAFLGLLTYRRGEKDRKSMGPAAIEIPLFLLSGPLADAIGAVHDISEQSRVQNELLRQLIAELRRNNELIEWTGNQAGIMSPPSRKPRT